MSEDHPALEMRKLGKTVEVLDNCCCGLLPLTYGERPAAERLFELCLVLEEVSDAVSGGRPAARYGQEIRRVGPRSPGHISELLQL